MVRKTKRRKPVAKKKSTKRKSRGQTAAGGHDQASRRKYDRGGRVEAYTFGEALGKDWP